MKVPEKLPVGLSFDKVLRFFRHIAILKYRVPLVLCYGSGLRSSETIALKVGDIDSRRRPAPSTATPFSVNACYCCCANAGNQQRT